MMEARTGETCEYKEEVSSDSDVSEESVYSGLEDEEDTDEGDASHCSEQESESEEIDNLHTSDKYQQAGSSGTWNSKGNVNNEYEFDSSDEEDVRNTIGNIPTEWYNDYPHIGYDWDGKRIMKPARGDELDKFLDRMENPNFWRTVEDKQTGQNVVLTDAELDMIRQIQGSQYPEKGYNPYEPWVDFFSKDVMIHPVTNHPPQKRSFIPSKWEKQKVGKIVHAIKMGWIKPGKKKEEENNFYNLWAEDDKNNTISKRLRAHIPAPKMKLPGHAESYNPPPEYLFNEEEKLAWENQDPEKRPLDFVPQKFSCLRHVPSYKSFIKDKFDRCLDLYLCPRQRRMRVNVDPEDLIPKLPKPRDLHPFPTTQALVYEGHTGLVRTISVEFSGQFLASGSDDGTVRVWEVLTGRCLCKLDMEAKVKSVSWCPSSDICLLAVAVGSDLLLVNPGVGDKLVCSATAKLVCAEKRQDSNAAAGTSPESTCKWEHVEEDVEKCALLAVKHSKDISEVVWHCKGDYFATVMPQGESRSVTLHQLSKQQSQNPFKKWKGLVQCVLFHPSKPFLLVATQRYIRIYNLLKQELTKKLLTNCKWVSSMSIHPGGDNVITGSYDCRLNWFDLDLSTKPYQTLRHHKKAIRQVCYHRRYPLFASASDDGTAIVCHGMVFNDLMQNALIVPVKILRGHKVTENLGVLDCCFHRQQPWLFTCGADTTIRLFT